MLTKSLFLLFSYHKGGAKGIKDCARNWRGAENLTVQHEIISWAWQFQSFLKECFSNVNVQPVTGDLVSSSGVGLESLYF